MAYAHAGWHAGAGIYPLKSYQLCLFRPPYKHTAEFTRIDGKRYPIVDETECVGCNLCYLVCPVPGCISLVRLDDGRQPLTWRELTNRQPLRSAAIERKNLSCRHDIE